MSERGTANILDSSFHFSRRLLVSGGLSFACTNKVISDRDALLISMDFEVLSFLPNSKLDSTPVANAALFQ